jgi:hypothetical protein
LSLHLAELPLVCSAKRFSHEKYNLFISINKPHFTRKKYLVKNTKIGV